MRNLLTKKYLLLSVTISLVVAALSLIFFPVEGFAWSIPPIVFLASFILSFFLVSLAKKGGAGRVAIIRYLLAGLVAVSVFVYFNQSKKIVSKVSDVGLRDGHKITTDKNIITGYELKDLSDPEVERINKSNHRDSIFDYIRENDPTRIWTLSSIQSNKIVLISSFILLFSLIAALLIYLATEMLFRNTMIEVEDRVFISYNHEDVEIAKLLCSALLENNIKLTVDSPLTASGPKVNNMLAGDKINSFIRNAVRYSKITLMLVSEKSLLSGWVATEAVNTFFLESFGEDKFFIGCYADGSFLNNDFTARAYTIIDQKMAEVDKNLANRMGQKADSRDLNDQKTRLFTLRGSLDKIIERLQTSKCIDISGDQLHTAVMEITKSAREYFNRE